MSAKKRTTWAEYKQKHKEKFESPEARQAYDDDERSYELAIKVRKIREVAGLTQTELAYRMGSTQPAIARIEGGGGNPNFDTLARIAEALGAELKVSFKMKRAS